MLPLCNYCAFFATRVNKMAADAYCVKNQTFLLVVIEHCKIAHFFRLEKLRNFTLYNFFSKTNIAPHFGRFSGENPYYLLDRKSPTKKYVLVQKYYICLCCCDFYFAENGDERRCQCLESWPS